MALLGLGREEEVGVCPRKVYLVLKPFPSLPPVPPLQGEHASAPS